MTKSTAATTSTRCCGKFIIGYLRILAGDRFRKVAVPLYFFRILTNSEPAVCAPTGAFLFDRRQKGSKKHPTGVEQLEIYGTGVTVWQVPTVR